MKFLLEIKQLRHFVMITDFGIYMNAAEAAAEEKILQLMGSTS